ncbi:YicC/YloC family endoribonuclease [Aliidiomarina sp. Khilg15.8]
MIYSMTAYAREEVKGDWGTAVWELRSVNQRYLETYFRLPEQFRGLETTLRERLRKKLQRGKVECNLRFNPGENSDASLVVNEELAKAVIRSAEWVQSSGGNGGINPLDILRWPGVISSAETDIDSMQGELMAGFDRAMEDFIAHRASEGENMRKLIEDRLDGIDKNASFVREQMPAVLQWQRERLLTKFEEAKLELDAQRVEQEMVMLAQKVDVAEELDRLDSHIKETRAALKKGGACGRRLDFMMQEFNREANTLASKSINADVTNAAVELKVLIEQMREQIQNIE